MPGRFGELNLYLGSNPTRLHKLSAFGSYAANPAACCPKADRESVYRTRAGVAADGCTPEPFSRPTVLHSWVAPRASQKNSILAPVTVLLFRLRMTKALSGETRDGMESVPMRREKTR